MRKHSWPIRRPGLRLFLLYGSDAGAITERARRIESIALKRGGGDVALRLGSDELSGSPGRIADEAYSTSHVRRRARDLAPDA